MCHRVENAAIAPVALRKEAQMSEQDKTRGKTLDKTTVTLGIALARITTVGDLLSGIEQAEKLLGYTVKKIADGTGVPD